MKRGGRCGATGWEAANERAAHRHSRTDLVLTAAAGGTVYISSISFVEIVYLVEKGRLPEGTLEDVQGIMTAGAKLELVPVDAAVALRIRGVDRSIVPDMPDRIIAATALTLNVPLVTRDGRIRATTLKTIW